MTSAPKLAILADYYYPAVQAGGPPVSIRERVLSSSSTRMAVVTRNRDHVGEFGTNFNGRVMTDGVPVYYLATGLSAASTWMGALRIIRTADAVWINSLHSVIFAVAPILWLGLSARGPKILISPRGELIDAHRAHRRYRKMAWHLTLKALRIHRKVTWLATTEGEAAIIENSFPGARVLVSPEVSRYAKSNFVPRALGNTLQLLFLGRIAPLKGLLQAVKMIAQVDRPVILTVAGASQDGKYLREVENAIGMLPASASVRWHGVASREDVENLIRDHDALILPTTGESFGHSIAESLALGRPVLTTPTTPWNFGAESGAVTFIDRDDVSASARRIDDFASVDDKTVFARQGAAHNAGSQGISDGLTIDEVSRLVVEEHGVGDTLGAVGVAKGSVSTLEFTMIPNWEMEQKHP